MRLNDTISRIGPPLRAAETVARQHQEALAIPRGSLGRLHDIGIQLAAITGDARPAVEKTGIITMAGDHGVAAQGVSCFPQEVTREMVANFIRGGAAINALSEVFDSRLTVVDIGVAGEAIDGKTASAGKCRLVSARIAAGTADMTQEPAMTPSQAEAALNTGISIFIEEHTLGLDAVGTGDMGIANTTSSAAIASVLLGCPPEKVVNRGTGIDDDILSHKISVVERSLKTHRPDPDDALDLLAKVGGFEIGGIAGVILAACAHRTPVVVDGFISTAAAMLASRFNPHVKHYLFSGHQSAVEGHDLMLADLGIVPLVNLGMRLGEGTGAAFGLAVLKAASRVACRVLTFDEARVSGPGAGD